MERKLTRREFLLKVGGAAGVSVIGTALAACAAPPATAPAPQAPAQAPAKATEAPAKAPAAKAAVKIVWGTPWQGNPPFIQENMRLFAEAFPDISAEYMPIADFTNKIKTMAAAHSLPDVFYLDSAMGPEWAALGAVVPMDDWFKSTLKMEELGEDFLALSGEFKGKHWMLCNAQGPMGFYYNKDAFDEVGLKYPTEAWTWDDMLAAALKLTKRTGDKVERFGLTVTRFSSFVFQNNGEYLDKDRRKCLLDQPPAVEALQWVADLYFKHKVAPLPADIQLQPTTFQNGRIAMAWGDGPWSIGSGGYREAPFKWDVTFVPRGKRQAVINYGSGMGVSSETKNSEQAWKFARFWLEYQPQLNFHGTWESMPILKKAIDYQFVGADRKKVPENYPSFAQAITGPKKYSIVEPYIPGYFTWLWHHTGSTLYNDVMSLAITGEKKVSETIGPFVKKVNDYINEQSKNW